MDAASTLELHTGRRMPVFGLGTWKLTEQTADTVAEALRLGYRMIDTAADYGSQPGIGEALHGGVIDRGEVYLSAKVEENEDPMEATRRYLGEMKQDYADLMILHRPPPGGPGIDLWRGLIGVRDAGLCRDIGVSNYRTDEIDALIEATGEVPVVNQIEWSPFGFSMQMLEYCRDNNIVVQAYCPLTHGKRLDDPKLGDIAKSCGAAPAQVLLRWCLQRGTVPLPKANQHHHLVENLRTFDLDLDPQTMAALDDLNQHYSALGPSLAYV